MTASEQDSNNASLSEVLFADGEFQFFEIFLYEDLIFFPSIDDESDVTEETLIQTSESEDESLSELIEVNEDEDVDNVVPSTNGTTSYHLTEGERVRIQNLNAEGKSVNEIAVSLGRDKRSINRWLTR